MADPGNDSRLFLQPAEAVFAESPAQVRTVLGSCVAVTMRAPRLGVAAAAHCVLPTAGAAAAALPHSEAFKYVDTAIDLMMLAFAQRGATAPEIEVKLFGGADSLGGPGSPDSCRVGKRNVEAALAALAERGIVPAASVLVRRLPGGGKGKRR
jgi:chemotaxis protein CheD